jgi:hypothetical protein
VPGNLNRAAIRSTIKSPALPGGLQSPQPLVDRSRMAGNGRRTADSRVPDNEMVTLMETPGAYAQAYLLTTNYRSILDYNCSNLLCTDHRFAGRCDLPAPIALAPLRTGR